MEREEERKAGREGEVGGLVFVACMFIGGGLGLAFGQAAVGWLLGMGIGFLLMGLLRTKGMKREPLTIGLPASTYRIALLVLGIFIVFSGLSMLYWPTIIFARYIPGVILVIVGVLIMMAAMGGKSKRDKNTT